MGIEPTSEAWEALNKTLKAIDLATLSMLDEGLNWKPNGNGIFFSVQYSERCVDPSPRTPFLDSSRAADNSDKMLGTCCVAVNSSSR